MPTIIQNYGPIYGEVVNGTVQGRPNGSVYVPLSNTIEISLGAATLSLSGTEYRVSPAKLLVTANSQDLSSNIKVTIYSDALLTTKVGTSRSLAAGQFNTDLRTISYGSDALISSNTYYVVAELVNNSVAVATSNVIEVVAA